MSPETKKLFLDFAKHLHWNELGHPGDMDAFWDVVIAAYRNEETDISLDDFLEVMKTTDERAERDPGVMKKRVAFLMFLYNKYEDGMMLLKKFEKK